MNIINRLLPPNSFNIFRWIIAGGLNLKHLGESFNKALSHTISPKVLDYITLWMQQGDHRAPSGNDVPFLLGHLIYEMFRIFFEHMLTDWFALTVFLWLLSETGVLVFEYLHWRHKRRNQIWPINAK